MNANTNAERNWIDVDQMEALFDEYVEQAVESLGVTAAVKTSDRGFDPDEGHYVSAKYGRGEHVRDLPITESFENFDETSRVRAEKRTLYDVRNVDEGDLAADSEYVTERARHIGVNSGRHAYLQLGWDKMPTTREIRIAEHLLDADYEDSDRHLPTSVRKTILTEILGHRPLDRDDHDLWVGIRESMTKDIKEMRAGLTAIKVSIDGDSKARYDGFDEAEPDDSEMESIWTASGYSHTYVTVENWEAEDRQYGWDTKAYLGSWTHTDDEDEIYQIDLRNTARGSLMGTVDADGEEVEVNVEWVGIPELPDPADVLDVCENEQNVRPVTDGGENQ